MPMQQNGNIVNPYSSIGQMQNYPSQNMMNGNGSNYQNSSMQQNNMNNMQVQPSFLPGRVIREEQDILPGEVPMNGNVAVFVQQDLQRIYAKSWGRDGLIHTNVYDFVDLNRQNGEPKEDPIGLILERLDRIEETLKRDKPRNQNNRPPKKNYPHRGLDKEVVREEK